MLPLAKEQFAEDWSDEAIARNCISLAQKPPDEQERLVASARQGLPLVDCKRFVACDLADKEQRWTPRADAEP